MDALQQLLDIEEIRQLKYRYQRNVDQRDWDGLTGCFTDDAYAELRGLEQPVRSDNRWWKAMRELPA